MATPPPSSQPVPAPDLDSGPDSGSEQIRTAFITSIVIVNVGAGIVIVALSVKGFVAHGDAFKGSGKDWAAAVSAAVLAAVTVLLGRSTLRDSRADRIRTEQAQRRLRQAEDQLATADELTLPALWAVTQKRLNAYHEIATGQARTSFRNAQGAMVAGFLLLGVFAILAANTRSTTAGVVTGALGAVAAALAGYISRTFVRSQETSAGHLRSYFDQPLEFSRYLAAERLLNSGQPLKPEQRAAILADLLRTVVAPGGSAPTSAPDGGAAAAPSAITINLPGSPPAGSGGPAPS